MAMPTAERLSVAGGAAGTAVDGGTGDARFRATGAIAYSFGRLQDELQLQEAKRHILTQLEKIICYDAQRVIRLQENGQITCTMIDACKTCYYLQR